MSEKSTWSNFKHLAEDVVERLAQDSPDNFAGRDINQDSSEKTTNIENFTQKGDIFEGNQHNTIIDTKSCEPESISVKEVDAPFWDNDIKTIDIKCKEEDQPEAYAKPEPEPEPEPELNDTPLLESQDLGVETLPEPEFEFEWGG
ncbi:hypothetical protein B5D77_11815 [Microcystis sp. MC19]|uniref:hypothetical protein n=1 Tax=Microcystis sp. MC19 TaxID=1967666 RepID=UPI000D13BFEF|nr:hypothetical protein [Microcystis sp. MC19]AVQ71894.1 hypothetical protein B5D77_11815 [Microcystis sp. MC19]